MASFVTEEQCKAIELLLYESAGLMAEEDIKRHLDACLKDSGLQRMSPDQSRNSNVEIIDNGLLEEREGKNYPAESLLETVTNWLTFNERSPLNTYSPPPIIGFHGDRLSSMPSWDDIDNEILPDSELLLNNDPFGLTDDLLAITPSPPPEKAEQKAPDSPTRKRKSTSNDEATIEGKSEQKTVATTSDIQNQISKKMRADSPRHDAVSSTATNSQNNNTENNAERLRALQEMQASYSFALQKLWTALQREYLEQQDFSRSLRHADPMQWNGFAREERIKGLREIHKNNTHMYLALDNLRNKITAEWNILKPEIGVIQRANNNSPPPMSERETSLYTHYLLNCLQRGGDVSMLQNATGFNFTFLAGLNDFLITCHQTYFMLNHEKVILTNMHLLPAAQISGQLSNLKDLHAEVARTCSQIPGRIIRLIRLQQDVESLQNISPTEAIIKQYYPLMTAIENQNNLNKETLKRLQPQKMDTSSDDATTSHHPSQKRA